MGPKSSSVREGSKRIEGASSSPICRISGSGYLSKPIEFTTES